MQSQVCLRREFQREGAATEGSVTPGLVLGPGWWRQEVGIKGVEPSGRSVTMEQVGEVDDKCMDFSFNILNVHILYVYFSVIAL